MSITLPEDMAKMVAAKIASGEYEDESDVVEQALAILSEQDDATLAWLVNEVGPVCDAMERDPARARSTEQVRARIASEAERLRRDGLMPHTVQYSPEAEEDLARLFAYISEQSSVAVADRYMSALLATCESLAAAPYRGTLRDDIRPDLRTIGFRRRVTIAFQIKSRIVQIQAIVYGGRSLEVLMVHRSQ